MNLRCNSCDGIYGSLDIRLTKRCYNKCPFCIEKKSSVSTRRKDPDTEKMLDNILNINQDLRSTLIPNQDIESVLILGGEPLLLCSTSTTKLCKHQDLFKTYIFKGIDDLDIIPITII